MADPWSTGAGDPAPEHSGPPRRHLVLVAFIALLAVVVAGGAIALLTGSAVPEGIDVADGASEGQPDGATTAAPSPAPPSPAPDEDPPDDEDPPEVGQPADIQELAQQVAEIRDLPLRTRLRSRSLTLEGLADKVSALAFSELDPEEVADNEQLLVALRLAPPDIDLAGLLEDLYREQVLGLYVPDEKTLYVGRQGAFSPGQRQTTAHEITHALQDQAFDMVRLQKKYEDDADASLAVLSLIEGDAVLTQQLWAQEHLTPDERQQAATEGGGGDVLSRVPPYLRASLFFPYTQGGYFVGELYRTGGFGAVDDAFRNPPTTSEHIMHPQRYLDGDEAVAVTIDTRPAPGWEQQTKYAFGEFDVRELLTVLGGGTAAVAGEGWDGGEVRSWSKGPATAVGAVLAFDTPEDTAEACEALPQWYAEVADGREVGPGAFTGDRDHMVLECADAELRFALAPSVDIARRMVASP